MGRRKPPGSSAGKPRIWRGPFSLWNTGADSDPKTNSRVSFPPNGFGFATWSAISGSGVLNGTSPILTSPRPPATLWARPELPPGRAFSPRARPIGRVAAARGHRTTEPTTSASVACAPIRGGPRIRPWNKTPIRGRTPAGSPVSGGVLTRGLRKDSPRGWRTIAIAAPPDRDRGRGHRGRHTYSIHGVIRGGTDHTQSKRSWGSRAKRSAPFVEGDGADFDDDGRSGGPGATRASCDRVGRWKSRGTRRRPPCNKWQGHGVDRAAALPDGAAPHGFPRFPRHGAVSRRRILRCAMHAMRGRRAGRPARTLHLTCDRPIRSVPDSDPTPSAVRPDPVRGRRNGDADDEKMEDVVSGRLASASAKACAGPPDFMLSISIPRVGRPAGRRTRAQPLSASVRYTTVRHATSDQAAASSPIPIRSCRWADRDLRPRVDDLGHPPAGSAGSRRVPATVQRRPAAFSKS